MYTDMHGVRRLKVGLHTHTTRSDGHKSPEEASAVYKALGYDALAFTDHWIYASDGEADGLTLLSGCEYNIGGNNAVDGVYHIVGVCMDHDPEIPRELLTNHDMPSSQRGREIIRRIREVGGVAIFAHPAWSLNTPEQIMAVGDFDGLEIYNSVSEAGMSDRPYSGLLVDMIAARGVMPPLLATDDTHYYTGDEGRGFIMLEAEAVETMGYAAAIKAGKFYASQGPEIHLQRVDKQTIHLTCSPADKIVFLSNIVWTQGRVFRGRGMTEATYTINPGDTFVRAEVTDKAGKCAWSGILPI